MNLKKLKNNKKGFTLIEIIVVVVILAVLMAVAVPAVMSYLDEADNAKYETQARAVYTRVQTEYAKAYVDKDRNSGAIALNIAKSKFDDVDVSDIKYTVTDKNNVNAVTCTITIDGTGKVVKIEANKKVTVDATALSGDNVKSVIIDTNK